MHSNQGSRIFPLLTPERFRTAHKVPRSSPTEPQSHALNPDPPSRLHAHCALNSKVREKSWNWWMYISLFLSPQFLCNWKRFFSPNIKIRNLNFAHILTHWYLQTWNGGSGFVRYMNICKTLRTFCLSAGFRTIYINYSPDMTNNSKWYPAREICYFGNLRKMLQNAELDVLGILSGFWQ